MVNSKIYTGIQIKDSRENNIKISSEKNKETPIIDGIKF